MLENYLLNPKKSVNCDTVFDQAAFEWTWLFLQKKETYFSNMYIRCLKKEEEEEDRKKKMPKKT